MEKPIGIRLNKTKKFGPTQTEINYEISFGTKRAKDTIFLTSEEVRKIIKESKLVLGKTVSRINIEMHGENLFLKELGATKRFQQTIDFFGLINNPRVNAILLKKMISNIKSEFGNKKRIFFRTPTKAQKQALKLIGSRGKTRSSGVNINKIRNTSLPKPKIPKRKKTPIKFPKIR